MQLSEMIFKTLMYYKLSKKSCFTIVQPAHNLNLNLLNANK